MSFSQGGQRVELTSTPLDGGTPTQVVTLGEIRKMQSSSDTSGNADIRVPLVKGSLIDLVNGGIKLPEGVDQEFFMIAQK